MAVKIKLKRLGKIRQPHYRIVVADARAKRDGRVIEEIGQYHPKEDPSFINVDSERAQYWLGVGAQPTDPVAAILRVTGDWQQFKGLPAPPPMKTRAEKPDKKALFDTAAREAAAEPKEAATTPKAKARKPAGGATKGAKAQDAKARGAEAAGGPGSGSAPAQADDADVAADKA
ncbi:MAG: 30S ribosomal protein S16 [Carbonactinosporaceae bacterium]